MIDPPPDARSAGTVAMIVFHTPVRLMSIIVCQVSSSMSASRLQLEIPAVATTTSSLAERVRAITHERSQALQVAHVDDAGDDLRASGAHQPRRLREILLGRHLVARLP